MQTKQRIICDIRHNERVRIIESGIVTTVITIRQVYKPEEQEAEYLLGSKNKSGRTIKVVGAFKRSQIERA